MPDSLIELLNLYLSYQNKPRDYVEFLWWCREYVYTPALEYYKTFEPEIKDYLTNDTANVLMNA